MTQEAPATAAIEALKEADVSKIMGFLQTDGLAFGIDLALALTIFVVGRMVIGLVVRGIAKGMEKNGVDKTLNSFVCNLTRTALPPSGKSAFKPRRSLRFLVPRVLPSVWHCRDRCPISRPVC